jgi:hypothetical protein
MLTLRCTPGPATASRAAPRPPTQPAPRPSASSVYPWAAQRGGAGSGQKERRGQLLVVAAKEKDDAPETRKSGGLGRVGPLALLDFTDVYAR